jgi:AcrR family transcriptional regulator
MAEPVKGTRRYESPRRRAQAAATRTDILVAAQALFEERGFAATTIADVAAAAGVAHKTVYATFGSKGGLLRAVWHLLLRGDTGDAPVGERRWYLDVLEEPDPVRVLRRAASASRAVKERAGGILQVIRSAAPADPEVGELWRRIGVEFYDNQRAIVEALDRRGALAPGLDVGAAADLLWTLNHPDVWQLLARERGWRADRFERWLGDTLCAQLLHPGVGDGSAGS